jgi:hypothetical protein
MALAKVTAKVVWLIAACIIILYLLTQGETLRSLSLTWSSLANYVDE